jgi:choline-glycine betaine transporter
LQPLLHAAGCARSQGLLYTIHPHLGARRWVSTALDIVEAGIMAACMLFAVGCFSRVLTTRGHDVQLVMKGISSERGLAKLFSRLAGVQKGVRSCSQMNHVFACLLFRAYTLHSLAKLVFAPRGCLEGRAPLLTAR